MVSDKRHTVLESMVRAKAIDVDLQRQLLTHMESLPVVPLSSITQPNFTAANHSGRADKNIILGSKAEKVEVAHSPTYTSI